MGYHGIIWASMGICNYDKCSLYVLNKYKDGA